MTKLAIQGGAVYLAYLAFRSRTKSEDAGTSNPTGDPDAIFTDAYTDPGVSVWVRVTQVLQADGSMAVTPQIWYRDPTGKGAFVDAAQFQAAYDERKAAKASDAMKGLKS